MTADRRTGVVKKVITDRGFGFIKPDDGGPDTYVHASGLRARGTFDDLQEGERVEFEMGTDPRNPNEERAVDVVKLD
jgi:CspA family cold shock protein